MKQPVRTLDEPITYLDVLELLVEHETMGLKEFKTTSTLSFLSLEDPIFEEESSGNENYLDVW